MTDYAALMKCFIVGIPRFEEMNGDCDLEIGKVIAPCPEEAVRNYLRREAPDCLDKVLGILAKRQRPLGDFAYHAPSHDIARGRAFSAEELARQNEEIVDRLAKVCYRGYTNVRQVVNKLLPSE